MTNPSGDPTYAREIDELLDYAEFLVWVDEVDTGMVAHAAAEDLIGYYYAQTNATEAVKGLWHSSHLFSLYRKWSADESH